MPASTARIRRSAHNPTNPYVMIRRDAAAASRLSWKARGLLAYLLSLPDGWDIAVRDLVHRGPDGRDAVYTALQELKACGYLTEEIERHPTRKHTVNRYYVLWESPPTPACELDPENPDQGPPTESELDPENPDQARPFLRNLGFLDRDLERDPDPEKDPEEPKELNTHPYVSGDRQTDPAGNLSVVNIRLVAAGMAAPVAQRLVAVHGPARCETVLTWLDRAHGPNRPRCPAGWIRQALEEHWPAPPWAYSPPSTPPRWLTVLCPTCGDEFAVMGPPPSRVPCPQCAAAVALSSP